MSDGGINEAMAELTEYRRKIRRPNEDDEKLNVVFNDYMNCLMGDPTEEKEKAIIDKAAEMGCEYYCLDCGWYDKGFWWDRVGEWKESSERFPNTLKAVCDYAKEKGSYRYFEGSDWESGAYFEKRGYCSDEWKELREKVHRQGMRNAYLLAIAPTSSTSIIAGTTAGIDPVMNKYFLEEKKGSMLPRVAPDLSPETYWYYINAHHIDQNWSVRACGVRQRHVDLSLIHI